MLEEVLEAAVESDLGDDLLHLVANPFYLVEANAMDLVGSQARCGEGASLKLIPGTAILEIGQADTFPGCWQVPGIEIAIELLVGG